jgi:hypothetical protein
VALADTPFRPLLDYAGPDATSARNSSVANA